MTEGAMKVSVDDEFGRKTISTTCGVYIDERAIMNGWPRQKTLRDYELTRGNVYFVALGAGDVFQGEYMGRHESTDRVWFRPVPFCNAQDGPQWIPSDYFAQVFDLGRPTSGAAFDDALSQMLE